MYRRLQNTFRTSASITGIPNINIFDALPINTNSSPQTGERTIGGRLLDQAQFQPLSPSKWTLQSFSITANLYVQPVGGLFNPSWARFGKILAGVQTQGGPTPTVPNVGSFGPYSTPMDLTTVTDLWDPASDPPPGLVPAAGIQPVPLPISAILNLPQPLDISAGTVLVGIWLLPSLISNNSGNQQTDFQVIIADGNYSLIYDDGLGDSKDVPSGLVG